MNKPVPTNPLNVPANGLENISEPFKGDLFGRDKLATKLTHFLDRLPHGGVFALDAPWGEGKTWFGRHWAASLTQKGYQTVFIDNFQRDYLEDPFLMISGEILSALRNDESTRKTLLSTAMKVGKAIFPLTGKVAINVAGRVLAGSADLVEDCKIAYETLAEGCGEALEQYIQKRLQQYDDDIKSVESFRYALTNAVSRNTKPMVIFVDELDRCRPDFAVKTIERIKHFFEVKGLVFVLLINRGQLEASFRGVYGAELDANSYLSKFIKFSLTLPKRLSLNDDRHNFNFKFCKESLNRYGFPDSDASNRCASEFSKYASAFGMSLRDIERGVVLYSLAQPIAASLDFLSWPIVLKIKWPDLFHGVLSGVPGAHQRAIEKLHSISEMKQELWTLPIFQELHSFHASNCRSQVSNDLRQQLPASIRTERFIPLLCEKIDLTVNLE